MTTPPPDAHHEHSHAHQDGHGHTHGHDHGGGTGHALSHFFRGHSHDTADQVDGALESSRKGIRAVKLSLILLLVTSLIQAGIFVYTRSTGLLADTIHNFSDALTALPLWVAFMLGTRKPTRRYTYGYGRAEDVAGVFIVLMMALSTVLAAVESLRKLISGSEVQHPCVVIVAAVVGFAGNEIVATYRIRTGHRIGSAALVADGVHARTDGFTSLAVVLGAVGVLLGWPLADPLVGLLITVAIVVMLISTSRQIYHRLMDAVDPTLTEQAERAALAVPQVAAVRRMRLRWLGHRIVADTEVSLAGALTFEQAHELSHDVETRMLHDVPRLDEVVVHVSPGG